jgi:hypothetical protein
MHSEERENSHRESGQSQEKLPPVGEVVWVECGSYRTLAYRDAKGAWRTVAKNEEVKVTRVLGSTPDNEL